jgi:hypothetical protein
VVGRAPVGRRGRATYPQAAPRPGDKLTLLVWLPGAATRALRPCPSDQRVVQ